MQAIKGTMVINGQAVDYKHISGGEREIIVVSATHTIEYTSYKKGLKVTEKKVISAKGVAKCDPADRFNLKYGVRLAFRKAVDSIEKQMRAILEEAYISPIKAIRKSLNNELTHLESRAAKLQSPEYREAARIKFETRLARKQSAASLNLQRD